MWTSPTTSSTRWARTGSSRSATGRPPSCSAPPPATRASGGSSTWAGWAAGGALSSHLESRQEVGRILAASGVETIEFRASIVIGSGSLSFEMVRALVERLPVMVTPRWVRTPTQPIAIEDVVAYLAAALDLPAGGSRVYEIGGADVVSYGELMREYARQRGLRRTMIEVPVLSPRLSSLWLSLITPLYAQVGRKLVDGVRNETLVSDDAARRDFDIAPRGVREAIERALRFEDREFAETRWSDAGQPRPGLAGNEPGPRMIDSRVAHVPCPPAAGVRTDRPDRRTLRVVRGRPAVGAARADRPAVRRRRAAPRPARSGDPRPRRHAGLLAGRGVRARPAAAAGRRDAAARPGLAAVRGHARRRRRLEHPPDGRVRSDGRLGSGILVRPLSFSRADLPADDPGDRPAGDVAAAENTTTSRPLTREGCDERRHLHSTDHRRRPRRRRRVRRARLRLGCRRPVPVRLHRLGGLLRRLAAAVRRGSPAAVDPRAVRAAADPDVRRAADVPAAVGRSPTSRSARWRASAWA